MKKLSSRTAGEPRNLGVTVIAACFALLAGTITYSLLPLNLSDINSIIFFSIGVVVFLLTLAVAIYGRKSILKTFIEGLMNYSA